MVSEGWKAAQPPESDIELMNQFVEGETRLNSDYVISEDKKTGQKRVEIIPTAYPELNTKDLKIGNIDTALENIAINANLRAAQAIKYYAEKTGFDLRDSYKFMLATSLRRLALSSSKNATLLKELRGRRLIEEGTQHIYEKTMPEQRKKLFGLF